MATFTVRTETTTYQVSIEATIETLKEVKEKLAANYGVTTNNVRTKWHHVFVVQGNYGQGYEDVSHPYLSHMQATLAKNMDNKISPEGIHRVVTRKVLDLKPHWNN